MDEIQFADGFDAPERIAFGLGAGPLVVVVGGGLIAYALVRSPLPEAVSAPAALMVAGAAAALGWLRLGGRPALDWALFAARYAMRRRCGVFTVAGAPECGPRSPALTHARPDGDVSSPAAGDGCPEVRSQAQTIIALRQFHSAAPASAPLGVITVRDQVVQARPTASGTVEIGAAWHPPPAPRTQGSHRIAFFSLKGGTGRSTLATELACLLAADVPASSENWAPLRVALLDLDLRCASVSIRLGVTHRTIVEYALSNPDDRHIDDFLCTHESGVRVLLGPPKPVAAGWPVTPLLAREVLRELDAASFDIVVADLAPELTPLTTTVLGASDDVFVVVSASAGGIQDAYRSTEQLRRMGVRHQLRYVVNRSRTDIDLAEAVGDLGGQLLAEIPEDGAFVDAENRHLPVGLHTRGPAATALRRLARRVRSEVLCGA
jgi:MinD-like ATPase involved in chromosome partitioning or flagellar assembly